MHISPAGLNLITSFEGFSPTAYLCPAGIWTIGYGHAISSKDIGSAQVVDKEQAELLLRRDVMLAEQAVRRFINVALRQNEFDALVCFTFNLGSGVLQRSTLRQVINRADHSAVSSQWMRWVWARGRKLPGLVRRRASELDLYLA